MSVGAADHPPLREDGPEKTFFDDLVKIPGYGRSPDRCAGYSPVGFCEGGHVLLGKSSCGTRRCSDHWRDWCEDAVIAIVARLAAFRHVQEGAQKRVSHVVLSPPQDRRWSKRELFATRRDAYDVADEAGIRGGAVVAHGYRTNDRGNVLYETAKEQGELPDGTGKWRFLRDVSDGDWPDLTRFVEPAPHYHIPIAPAADVQELEESDWVVKRIRSLDRFHIRDTASYRDMARTTYYVLTHGCVCPDRATTTYFGDVHPSTFVPEEELTKTEWERIQREAETAVKLAPGESRGDGPADGPDECPRDECEAVVRELGELPERLRDSDFRGAVRRQRGGRKRLARLEGAALWTQGMTDRPPPHVATDEKKFGDWLEDVGEIGVGDPRQTGLSGLF